jgi:hypothetical protein
MGGMLAATFLAIFFVPLFFRVITDRKLREVRTPDELRGEVEEGERRSAELHRAAVEKVSAISSRHGGGHA